MKQYNKIIGFLKQIFISAMMFFGCNLPSINTLKCISMNNQEFKVRPQIVNVTSEEPVFFLLVLKQVNAVVAVIILMIHMQNCVPDVVKKFKCQSISSNVKN